MPPRETRVNNIALQNVAVQVAKRLSRSNLAKLRSASRGTRNFALSVNRTDNATNPWCRSAFQGGRLIITTRATLYQTGAEYPCQIQVRPRLDSTHGTGIRARVALLADFSVQERVVGMARLAPDGLRVYWYSVGANEQNTHQDIRDQLTSCLARELYRHAAALVQSCLTLRDNVIFANTAPVGAAQLRESIRRIRQPRSRGQHQILIADVLPLGEAVQCTSSIGGFDLRRHVKIIIAVDNRRFEAAVAPKVNIVDNGNTVITRLHVGLFQLVNNTQDVDVIIGQADILQGEMVVTWTAAAPAITIRRRILRCVYDNIRSRADLLMQMLFNLTHNPQWFTYEAPLTAQQARQATLQVVPVDDFRNV